MEIIPKLNLNRNPKDVPNNSIVAAKNMVVDDTGSYYTNEWGFKVAFECPNNAEFICGVIPTNKEFIIFTYCTDDKVSRIYRKSDDSTYEVNVGWKYSGGKITGSYTYNYKGELIIAVGEYDAVNTSGKSIQVPYKSWNLDDTNNTEHNQEEEIGRLSSSYTIGNGNLVCGVYTFFIRYAVSDVDYTKWFQLTPEVIIVQAKQKEAPSHNYLNGDTLTKLDTTYFTDLYVNDNKLSDKSIVINIDNVDDSKFLKYQIGYIIKREEEVLGRIQNEYDVNTKSVIIADNTYTQEESIDEFLKNPNQLYNVKNIINYNNRIYLSNYEEYINENANAYSSVNVDVDYKASKTSEASESHYNVKGQISYNGVVTGLDTASFDISNVTYTNGKYVIKDYKSFIINYLVKALRLYNSVGEAVSPYSNVAVTLTDEGKKHWRSASQDFSVCLFKNDNSTIEYVYIYNSNNKTVSNVTSVYIKDEKLHIVVSATTRGTTTNTNVDICLTDWLWSVKIRTTYYLTEEEAGGKNSKYYTANYLTTYIADADGVGYRQYPIKGWKPTSSITVSTITNTYSVNNGIINRTLIPKQRYNIYVHYIRKDGSYTNGYFIKQITSDKINSDTPITYIKTTVSNIPNSYIGIFLTYEDVEANVIWTTKLFGTKVTNTKFLYNDDTIYGDTVYSNQTITGKTYNKSILTTSNVELNGVTLHDDRPYLTSNNLGLYYKKTKTLYRLTENYYSTGTFSSDAYLPDYYNKEKVIVFANSSNPTIATALKEVIFTATSSKVVDNTGSQTDYGLFVKSTNTYTDVPLDAYSIKQDYSKGAASLVTSAGGTQGVYYNSVLSPDKLHDFLEIKGCYTAKPSKSFTNYNEDYTDKFNKTIRRSNVISDESLVNGFRIFDDEQYRIIKENKGDITNIVGIGLYLLVHTQYSLFVFDRSPKLTNSSQLQIPDTFDIDYQEVLPSNEGFGGLSDKEESIVSKNGYIWYDSVNKIIFKYENGKASVLSADINNFIKDMDVSTVRFGEDLTRNRLIICIYVSIDNTDYPITVSYNFNTNTFISLHDYSFTNCYRTYDEAYFFDKIKDRNRLYCFDESETGYKNLRNINSIYYPKYDANNSGNSGAKPILPTSNTIDIIDYPILVDNAVKPYKSIFFKFKSTIKNYKYYRIYKYQQDTDTTTMIFDEASQGYWIDSYYTSAPIESNVVILYGYLYNTYEDFRDRTNAIDITPVEISTNTETLVDVQFKHNDTDTVWNDIISFNYNNSKIYNPGVFNYVNDNDANGYRIYGNANKTISYRKYHVTVTSTNGKTLIDETVNHDDTPDIIINYIACKRVNNNIIVTNTSDKTVAIDAFTTSHHKNSSFVANESMTIDDRIAEDVSIAVTYDNTTTYKKVRVGSYMFNPTINIVNDNELYFTVKDDNGIEDTGVDLYYTLNGADPYESGIKYDLSSKFIITLSEDCKIKAMAKYEVADELRETYSEANYIYTAHEEIDDKVYTTKTLTDATYKNYIDIICNTNNESAKCLDSIQYILNNFTAKFNNMNPAEQLLNRRFSGDSIILYSDETYTGAININDYGNTNYLDNYKLPTFQKGHWEFNYFRNDVSRVLENGSFIAVYYDVASNSYKTKHISDEDIIKRFRDEAGDNKSLIYGRYIVARFIFNNDKRIKLEGVSFITNNY